MLLRAHLATLDGALRCCCNWILPLAVELNVAAFTPVWTVQPQDRARHLLLLRCGWQTKNVVAFIELTTTASFASAAHIEYDVANSTGSSLAHTYHALLTPHRTELSLLSLTPVLPQLSLYDFGLEFVPLEPDLLSLEEHGAAWHDLYVRGDQTVLHRCAMSLMTCQMLWGCFPRISGKGDFAKRLADLLLRQRREHLASDPSNPSLNSYSDVIDGLVIVERGTDMVTPMCNQLTYTGLIDELVGIKSAHVEMATDAQNAKAGSERGSSSTPLVSAPQRPTKKHRLDPISDVLYAHIRDLNFSVVGSTLHAFAKRLSTSYDGRHAAQTVSEMRAWVGKLGGLQSEHTALKLHTTLTEKLMAETNTELFNRCLEIQQNIVAGIDLATQAAAIEDLIHLEAPVQTVLRLLCLLSITGGGLKGKALDAIKRDVCQVYGFHWLPALVELERTGLLISSKSLPIPVGGSATGNSSAFDRVRQPLKLINDEVSEEDPSDVAYVYSGYAPLSVRLVQAVGQKEALMKAGPFGGGNASGNGAPGKAASRSKPRAHPLVGWKGFEDVLGAIPGETFDLQQTLTNTASAGSAASDGSGSFNAKNGSDPDRPRTTVVFFLGGITYAEVAALRFMGKTSRNRRWLIATTGIINGNGIVDDVARGSARGKS